MRWDREVVVAASFVLLSVGSAAFLSISTLNYLNYYPAVGKVQLLIESVSIAPKSSQSKIDVNVTVSNPTDYRGFRLENVIVDLSFRVQGSNATLFGSGVHPEQVQFVGQQLGANSVVFSTVIVQLNPSNATSFASFVNSYDGRVIASVAMTAQVITFLDTVYGPEYYMASQDLPLSAS